MAKDSRLGAVFGTDTDIIAKAVAATDQLGPLFMRHLAMVCGCGEAKIAITMKYAVKFGYMELTGRLPQNSWTRTDLGLSMFPPDRVTVPDEVTVEIDGVKYTAVPGREADTWEHEQIEAPPKPKELGP